MQLCSKKLQCAFTKQFFKQKELAALTKNLKMLYQLLVAVICQNKANNSKFRPIFANRRDIFCATSKLSRVWKIVLQWIQKPGSLSWKKQIRPNKTSKKVPQEDKKNSNRNSPMSTQIRSSIQIVKNLRKMDQMSKNLLQLKKNHRQTVLTTIHIALPIKVLK